MTKLMEWLSLLTVYFAVWIALISGKIESDFINQWMHVIRLLPLITLVGVGAWALLLVLWRVYSFNDCPEAALELQKQIKLAKEDLLLKGLKL